MQLFTRLAELRVAHEEQRVYKFVFEVTDCTCPVLSMENVLSSRDCRDDTKHRGNPNCARAGDLTRNSQDSECGKDPHQIRRSGPVEKSSM